ncbi:hypothetical protein [Rhizobium sp. NZLR1]|uniref:hypothetical protein n=1 Tax=Rhizobium sp. NZLR1 TaxID=2731096 RepID=UPI001A97E6A7|nr:hypothetical protein [Rhizobium sp. NZLR1]MBX5201034.1 hypothetical protein [Rhizobium sp. NZLR1]QSZ21535.1 hypothetical protein J3O30_02910 [Rhizobium sp. NZLR1]
MRLSDQLKPLALGLSLSLVAACGAVASETNYYNSKPWAVVLHVPDAQGVRPYCAIRTSLWDTRAISIETQIGAADAVTMAIRIHKDNWKLPLNQTTSVAFMTVAALGTDVTMKAISAEELYYAFPRGSFDQTSVVLSTLIQQVFSSRQPPPLTVRFGGNEPMWVVPALDRFQTIEFNEAFNRCDVDLRGLHASATEGNTDTSPFAAASSSVTPSGQSSSADRPQPATNWEFYTRDEDWGSTCFVQTHRGITMVGFIGSPGKELVGFVSSLFSGETKATWHVDDSPAYVVEGDQDDYFTWHSFGPMPPAILDQVAQGKDLAVTSAKGERVVIDLGGAADPVSKFKACFKP